MQYDYDTDSSDICIYINNKINIPKIKKECYRNIYLYIYDLKKYNFIDLLFIIYRIINNNKYDKMILITNDKYANVSVYLARYFDYFLYGIDIKNSLEYYEWILKKDFLKK